FPLSFSLLLSLVTLPTTTAIFTLSLHDALPISLALQHSTQNAKIAQPVPNVMVPKQPEPKDGSKDIWFKSVDKFEFDFGKLLRPDRKSTRLNSSHVSISYAVFCLKKKN